MQHALSDEAGSESLTGVSVTTLDVHGASATLTRPVCTGGCARGCGRVTLCPDEHLTHIYVP